MKNYEAFLAIREKISEDEGRIPQLETELMSKRGEQARLDEAAHRAWALDEPNAGKLKAAAEENEKAVFKLGDEVKKLKKRVELMKKENLPAQEAALGDLRVYYRKAVEPLIRELVKRLRAACDIERQLGVLRDESTAKMQQVTPYPRIVWPTNTNFLIPVEGRFENSPLGFFFKALERDEFDIGEDRK
jgi:hypothetical protein